MRVRLLAAPAVCLAVLAAGCGSENRRLIPSDEASALEATVAEIGSLAAEGECAAAGRRIAQARAQTAELPREVSRGLKTDINAWLDHIADRLPEDCTPQAEATATATATATETVSPTATPTEEATEEPTVEPTVTATETPEGAPTEAPAEGGVAPEEDGG